MVELPEAQNELLPTDNGPLARLLAPDPLLRHDPEASQHVLGEEKTPICQVLLPDRQSVLGHADAGK